MTYTIEFTAGAAKQVRKLDPLVRRRILAGITQLEKNPRPPTAIKLAGAELAWRIRVGDYRVIYEIEDEMLTVTIVRAAHRKGVYEQL